MIGRRIDCQVTFSGIRKQTSPKFASERVEQVIYIGKKKIGSQ